MIRVKPFPPGSNKRAILVQNAADVVAALDRGDSLNDISSRYGVVYPTVRTFVLKLGYRQLWVRPAELTLPPIKFVPTPRKQRLVTPAPDNGERDAKIAERNEKIVTLRDAGRTLEDIGSEVGVTRERVRQILVRLGRDDLRDVGCGDKKAKAKITSTHPCQQCGAPIRDTISDRNKKFCDNECKHAWVAFSSPIGRDWDRIVAERLAGVKWDTIAKGVNKNRVVLQTWLVRMSDVRPLPPGLIGDPANPRRYRKRVEKGLLA